jgi:hypothetical protein
MRRKRFSGSPFAAAQSLKVPIRIRSSRSRSKSMSAHTSSVVSSKRSVVAISSPSSWIMPWPSQARSVVLSPGPEAE